MVASLRAYVPLSWRGSTFQILVLHLRLLYGMSLWGKNVRETSNRKVREGGTHGEDCVELMSTLQPSEDPMPEPVDILWRNRSLWTAHAGAGWSRRSCRPWRTHAGAGARRKDWQRWTVRDWLQPHIPSSPVPLGRGRSLEESEMMEWSWTLDKKRGRGRRCFHLCFLLSKSFLMGNKLN